MILSTSLYQRANNAWKHLQPAGPFLPPRVTVNPPYPVTMKTVGQRAIDYYTAMGEPLDTSDPRDLHYKIIMSLITIVHSSSVNPTPAASFDPRHPLQPPMLLSRSPDGSAEIDIDTVFPELFNVVLAKLMYWSACRKTGLLAEIQIARLLPAHEEVSVLRFMSLENKHHPAITKVLLATPAEYLLYPPPGPGPLTEASAIKKTLLHAKIISESLNVAAPPLHEKMSDAEKNNTVANFRKWVDSLAPAENAKRESAEAGLKTEPLEEKMENQKRKRRCD